jgi:uncharacterized protein (DUF1697 family)
MTFVAFVRAINVAGHAVVRMDDLRACFQSAGCGEVRTCIQSGNVIFESREDQAPRTFQKIRASLRKLLGQEPGIVFRTGRELERTLADAPFKRLGTADDVKLYVTFLSEKPERTPKFPLRSAQEALDVIGMRDLDLFVVSRRKKNGFYGFPNLFVEKELGVPATSRNMSTITKIVGSLQKAPAK